MYKKVFPENKILERIVNHYNHDKTFSRYVKRLAARYRISESVILKKLATAAAIAKAV